MKNLLLAFMGGCLFTTGIYSYNDQRSVLSASLFYDSGLESSVRYQQALGEDLEQVMEEQIMVDENIRTEAISAVPVQKEVLDPKQEVPLGGADKIKKDDQFSVTDSIDSDVEAVGVLPEKKEEAKKPFVDSLEEVSLDEGIKNYRPEVDTKISDKVDQAGIESAVEEVTVEENVFGDAEGVESEGGVKNPGFTTEELALLAELEMGILMPEKESFPAEKATDEQYETPSYSAPNYQEYEDISQFESKNFDASSDTDEDAFKAKSFDEDETEIYETTVNIDRVE